MATLTGLVGADQVADARAELAKSGSERARKLGSIRDDEVGVLRFCWNFTQATPPNGSLIKLFRGILYYV